MAAGPPIHVVNAFAEGPYAGNPAAVCPLEGPADAAWMQSVARDMNLSETAFLHPEGDAWALRWFTPAVEVDLCGHATLAAASVLWRAGLAPADAPLTFTTRSGALHAARDGDLVGLDFPATPAAPGDAPAGLAEALGVEARWSGRTPFDWMVEVGTPGEVAAARPDMEAIAAIPCRGVILMAGGGDDGADVTSRFFGPGSGIAEDPVTGSAHCALGPLWAERLGRTRLVCHQASARGGRVYVEVRGERVGLAGRARPVLDGRLAGPPGTPPG